MTLRIGVIGMGVHGTRYARHAVQDVDGIELVACCRRDLPAVTAAAAEWGCRPHDDAHDLIMSPDVDAVIVATPPSTHFALTRDAMLAGKAVLLEKPVTGTLPEALELADLAAQRDAPPLMLAQTLRWNPVLMRVKELLPTLGRVRYLRLSQRLEPTSLIWQQDRSRSVGGSVLLEGVHLADTTRFLTGREIVEISSRQEQHHNTDVEDFFHATGLLDDGTHLSFEVSKFGNCRGCLLGAVGDEGQIAAEYYRGGITINRGMETTVEDVSAAVPTLPAVLAAWRDCVLNGSTPPVTVTDGVRTMEVVEACYSSHGTGRPIAVGGSTSGG